MQATLPPRALQRIERAKSTGYLVTSGYMGLSRWLDECALRQLPFVLVVKDRRRWRVSIELQAFSHAPRWSFTEYGESILRYIAAEHEAANIMSGADYFRASQLDQEPAEQIAARVITWVREFRAEQQAVAQ